jgi:hypothetical protein
VDNTKETKKFLNFDAFMAVMIQVKVIWVLTPPLSNRGHFTLNMKATRTSETSVSYYNITRHQNPENFD